MLEKEVIKAMAIAVIAEENSIEPENVSVLSFKLLQKSNLEQFIEDHHIMYHKYCLEDEKA